MALVQKHFNNNVDNSLYRSGLPSSTLNGISLQEQKKKQKRIRKLNERNLSINNNFQSYFNRKRIKLRTKIRIFC